MVSWEHLKASPCLCSLTSQALDQLLSVQRSSANCVMLGMQTLASLQGVRSAFLMGPKERAVYLRRPVPRGRQVVEQSGEEEAATVAGTNAAALRAWLRQVGHAHQPTA